ncbi:MAG: PHB depolymerase family esterase [Pirellulales bacterium]
MPAVATSQPPAPIVEPATDRLFTTQISSYSLGDEGGTVKYRLHIPAAAVSGMNTRAWPLLVWLHGFGEAGDDNISHIRWLNLLFRRTDSEGPLPCFVMAYQCPYERRMWSDGPPSAQPLTVAKAIVDEIIEKHAIDRDRIYLSGVSSGGTGCWEMLERYPTLFAAAVPLASAGSPSSEVSVIVDVPIWAFHTRDDPGTDVNQVRETVARLQAIGGKAYLTQTPGDTHDCWNAAFKDFHFVDWLLMQRKGSTSTEPNYATLTNRARLIKQDVLATGPQYYLPVPAAAICLYWWMRRRYRKRT